MYRDLAAARAALQAGPVRYRCRVCGGEHVSGRGEGDLCLDRLFEEYWFKLPIPRAYFTVPMALHFIRAIWERERAAGDAVLRTCFEEPMLAVRPSPRLPREVYDRVKAVHRELTRQYPTTWGGQTGRGTLGGWFSELERLRPPAEIASVSYSPVAISPRLPGVFPVSGWVVVPAVPGPGGERQVACSPQDLDSVVGIGKPAPGHERVLVALRYGNRAFAAVYAETCEGVPVRDPLVLVLEEYGCSAREQRIDSGLPPEAAVGAALRAADG